MNFLSPVAFWFGLALPAVVVFYLLKRKRVVRVVPSTLLWQKFLAETQASAPFQRLRHNWLLLLQLLLLLLAVLALARPYFSGKTGEAALQVVILDASASMQCVDESPNRFEKAKAEICQLIDGLKTGQGANNQQMLLMVAGASSEVRQSATSEKSALRRALDSVRVTDSPTRLTDALRVAEERTRINASSEVHLFSDGAIPNLDEFGSRDLKLIFHRVGQRSNNAGIVSLDVKSNPDDPSRRAIFASVANHSGVPISATMDLLFADRLVESKPLTLDTNLTPIVFSASQPEDGVFRLRLNHTDDLAADNEACVVSLLPQPVRILLVSRGNRFLEKALNAAASAVELSTAADLTGPGPAMDLIVLDDVIPSVWPAGNVLAIHVAPTNWFPGGMGRLEAPTIVDWRNTHPLLRFTTFENVQVAESISIKTPTWGVSLVDSPQSPLIVAGELGRQRIVWIGFETLNSTWPLRISFPIFIANAVDWLNPASARSEQFKVRAGDAFHLSIIEPVASARIRPPNGVEFTVPIDPKAREFVFGGTGKQGIYQVTLGTNEMAFAANLLDADESNTRPRDHIALGRRGEIAASTLQRANLEYWRWFAMAALAVMLSEWWWYHRRTA